MSICSCGADANVWCKELRHKERKLARYEQVIESLKNRLDRLEVENADLRECVATCADVLEAEGLIDVL